MGTRLYPNTRNVAALERLARVPAGTKARLEEMEARHKKELEPFAGKAPWERQEIEYRQWCEKNDDEAIGTLDAFETFGWGKFRPCGLANGYAGSLDDLTDCAVVLRGNGINLTLEELQLTEGLHWC